MKKITKVNNFKILKDLGMDSIYLRDSKGKTYILNEKGSKVYNKKIKGVNNVLNQSWNGDFSGQIFRPKLSGDVLYIIQHYVSGAIDEKEEELEITFSTNSYERQNIDMSLGTNDIHRAYFSEEDIDCVKKSGHPNSEIVADYFSFRNYLGMDDYSVNQITSKWPRVFGSIHLKNNFIEWFAAMTKALSEMRKGRGYVEDDLCNIRDVRNIKDVYTVMKMPPYTNEMFKSLYMDQVAGNKITVENMNHYYSRNIICETIFTALENLQKLSSMDYRYFEIITTSIENGIVNISELSEVILKMIENLDLTLEDHDTFIQYIKYNSYRSLKNVCDEYIEVIKYNKSRGLNPANPTQFSYELSLIKLVEAGFDQQVVDCFAEYIDVDVNKALSLIQEKKLSKKKKQEILQIVSEEFVS